VEATAAAAATVVQVEATKVEVVATKEVEATREEEVTGAAAIEPKNIVCILVLRLSNFLLKVLPAILHVHSYLSSCVFKHLAIGQSRHHPFPFSL
jgi:hypothetical protein